MRFHLFHFGHQIKSPLTHWYSKFAFFPVRIGVKEIIWLETYMRRRFYTTKGTSLKNGVWCWEYLTNSGSIWSGPDHGECL